MPAKEAPETTVLKRLFAQYTTDNTLSDSDACNLANQPPQQVARQIDAYNLTNHPPQQVTQLLNYTQLQLRNSFRSLRKIYPNPNASMQHNQQQTRSPKRNYSDTNNSSLFAGAPRPPSNNNLHDGGNLFGSSNNNLHGNNTHGNGNMFQDNNDRDNVSYSPKKLKFSHTGPPSPVDSLPGADVSDLATLFSNTQIDHPLANHQFRSRVEFLRMTTPLISNLSNNPADLKHQLTVAMKGATKNKIKANKELTQSETSVDWMRKEVGQDNQAYAYQLGGVRKELATHRALVAQLEAQERSLMSQQILNAGYAEVVCYIGKKAIRNIEEALLEFDSEDMEDLMKVEEAMNRWMAEVAEEQKVLLNSKEKEISDILDKINGV